MIKKLLSISVASLAFVACSDNGDDFALNSYGSDVNSLELQDASNIASSRETLDRNFESQYALTAFSSSNTSIYGSFKGPVYTTDGEVNLVFKGKVIARKPISSCPLMIPCPESGELPTFLRGSYNFSSSSFAGGTYTVRFVLNGILVKTATVDVVVPPTPNPGGGHKPEPFRPIDDRLVP